MLCQERFEQIYHKAPEYMSFCPYRVCPLGAHSDHNFGKVLGFAIDKGIHIAYGPKQNGVIELVSMQFSKSKEVVNHYFMVDGFPFFDIMKICWCAFCGWQTPWSY